MGKSVGSPLTPIDIRYATLALTPCTSRNCSDSAPGTTPAFQVFPPSVVTVNVPLRPEAHTTCGFTGLTAMRPFIVPLFCGVKLGWTIFGCPWAMRVAKATKKKGTRECLCMDNSLLARVRGQYRT